MTAATDGGLSAVVRCAEWLHSSVPCWLDADAPFHMEDALQELTTHLHCVSAYAQKGGCLPVKAALRVQVLALDSWNTTVLPGWQLERKDLKVQTRWLVAHLFLCSHCVFATQEVREAHLLHHLDDAEKCILMCLKTSKGLIQTHHADAAEQALSWATWVVRACAGTTAAASTVQRFSAEVQFAQLHAAWETGRHDHACVIAAQLAEETRSSITYTEALFEFIYDAAVKALNGPDFKADVLDGNTHASSEGQGMEPIACASGTSVSDVQAALQSLLLLSLRLQGEKRVRTVRQRTFLGMTQLQYGYSLLLSGNYDAAADAATRSYELLHTVEPLVIRFKAEVYRQAVDQVLALFGILCDDTAVDVENLCAMATLGMEKLSAVQETLFQALHRRVAASENVVDQFRLLCVLIHHCSEWSVNELLRRLSNGATPPPAFNRFLFCCLWRLSTEAVMAQSCCLCAETRWRCLDAAQRLFRDVASKEELQACLLDMARIALRLNDDGGDATEKLEETLRLCHQAEPFAGVLEASLLQSEAQIAFLLGKGEEGMVHVKALLVCTTGKQVAVQSCSEIVSFLLCSSLLHFAGAVAELCIIAFHQHQPPSCVLEFAKVFAMGCLVEHTAEMRVEIGSILVLRVCPLLEQEVLALSESQWWSRFLWYVSETLLDSDPVRAVRLLHTGVELQTDHRDSRDAEVIVGAADWLLRDRLSLLLDTEFDVFTAGQTALSSVELCRHRDRLASLLSSCDERNHVTDMFIEARQRVTLALARLETTLHDLLAHDAFIPDDMEALHLAELPSMPAVGPADLEQAAAACHRVAAHFPLCDSAPLCDAALTMMLEAARLQLTDNLSSTAALGALFANLYAAFKMARNGDGRLRVYDVLIAALPRLTGECASLRTAFLHSLKDSDHSPAVEGVIGMCETVVEFFAVEAWNESVQWNVLHQRTLVERWRAAATALTSVLSEANPSKAAITDLAAQMPLL
ncbi:hypothetical protein JKF63_06488 [Porcisia hertigi]|uniref:Uncharacterized protein n=1 Tax=Porcisia hertigi TaxID=2761500 RepID=A0A836I8Y7_9TRYP|nr:hypothetical protein JKF63_06488 [Porcisia hertigi]